MYNTSKHFCEKSLMGYESSIMTLIKSDGFSKTIDYKKKYPSLEYKKRSYNKLKSSIHKLEPSEMSESNSLYPEIKLEVSHIPNAKALNNEFNKKVYPKKEKKNDEGQQTTFDLRMNLFKKDLNNVISLNKNVHNKVLNFEKNNEDSINEQLIVLRRYSLYIFEQIQNIIKKKTSSANASPKDNNRNISKSMDTFNKRFKNLNIPYIPRLNLPINNEIKQEFDKAAESSANAIIEAINERRKNLNDKKITKTYSLKEKEVNPFFDNVLEKVLRKVNYLSDKNNPICEDYVVNLIHNEVKSITQNIENLIKSPAFIKNFSKKNDIDLVGNNNLLPLIDQSSINNTESSSNSTFNKTLYNSSNKTPNVPGHNLNISKMFSMNSNKMKNNLISIKEENHNEDNLNEYSEIANSKANLITKRNMSVCGEGLIKRDIPIRLSFNIIDDENNSQKGNDGKKEDQENSYIKNLKFQAKNDGKRFGYMEKKINSLSI